MSTAVGIAFLLLIVGAAFLFIARRVLRLALRLAFAVSLVFVLIAGGAVAWWQGWFGGAKKNSPPARQTTARPNSRARPTR